MNKKSLIAVGVIIMAGILLAPISPKNRERPRMTHKQWSDLSKSVPGILAHLEDQKSESGEVTLPVNVEELTGLHGISLAGVEFLLGRRTLSIVGYLRKSYVEGLYLDREGVWLDTDAEAKLVRIRTRSEQGGPSNGG